MLTLTLYSILEDEANEELLLLSSSLGMKMMKCLVNGAERDGLTLKFRNALKIIKLGLEQILGYHLNYLTIF